MAARVTSEQILSGAEGSPNARVTSEQVLAGAEGSPNARVTSEQILAGVAGEARSRVTLIIGEVLGTGVGKATSSAAEVMYITDRFFATSVVAEMMMVDPLRVTAILAEALKGDGGRFVTSIVAEILMTDPLRVTSTLAEMMRDPSQRSVTAMLAETLGDPFGKKVSAIAGEALGIQSWEPDLIIRYPSGSYLSLNDAGIPLPRLIFRAAREMEEPPAPRTKVGRPRIFLEWDFARPEWLVRIFGKDWVSGYIWTVPLDLEAINPPVLRVPGRNVRLGASVLAWRPDFHRDVRWDMGVWRDVRVECVVLSHSIEEQ